MFPRPIFAHALTLIFFSLSAILAPAAEAPYFEGFDTAPPNGVPANFMETTDADWSVSGGAYDGLIGLFSAEKFISASINLSNVAGQNFTITTKFSADMRGAGVTRIMDVSLGAFGTDPDLNSGQAHILNYNLAGLYDRLGYLSVSPGSVNYTRLEPTSGPYVMTLHGGFVDGMLFLSGTITNTAGTRSVRSAGMTPAPGSNFGIREHLYSGFQRSASLDVAHDEFSVALESEPVKLANISTRVTMRSGEEIPIVGFVVTGTKPKQLLIRAIAIDGDAFHRDPYLELYDSGGNRLALNDNWEDTQRPEIAYYGMGPIGSRDSALMATLKPGSYTAIANDRDPRAHRTTVEVYDMEKGVDARLANLSTRGYVGTGDDVMIAGVIVTGDAKARVIIRALGPTLSAHGVANVLADPTLELRNQNGVLVLANDNWRETQQTEIIATGIPPTNDLESAIVAQLLPANYTAIVRGKNDTTGVALVEVYHLN
jgi:hypothetical protein